MFINSAIGVTVRNILETWGSHLLDPGNIFDIRLNAVKYNKSFYAAKYPQIATYFKNPPAKPRQNVLENNIFYNVKTWYEGDKSWGILGKNYISDQNPGFVGLENRNLNLKSNSIVYKELTGFKTIPFSLIGRLENNKN